MSLLVFTIIYILIVFLLVRNLPDEAKNYTNYDLCVAAAKEIGRDNVFGSQRIVHPAVATPGIDQWCPAGLLQRVNPNYVQVNNGSCFYFAVSTRESYRDAARQCSGDGGTLAMPKTPSLNDFLTEQLFTRYGVQGEAWIGLHDMQGENRFLWADSSGLEWSNFAPDNGPNNGNWLLRQFEDCVALNTLHGGQWFDYQCDDNFIARLSKSKRMYICEYSDHQKPDRDRIDRFTELFMSLYHMIVT